MSRSKRPARHEEAMHNANDNQPRKIPPLITRLRRAGRQADIAALATLSIPAAPPQSANDNELADGFGIDTIFEIRPTPDEIVAAGEDGVRYDKRGHVTAWRVIDDDGKERWFRAREGYRQSKGTRRKSLKALAQDSARHLSLHGVGGFPEVAQYRARHSEGEAYWRIRHATMCHSIVGENEPARREIDQLGIGAAVPFAAARANVGLPPAERCPKAVARGARFLAGGVSSNETASQGSFVGAPDAAENAMISKIDAPSAEAALGQHTAVLQDSLDGLSAREIAAKRGWGDGKGAEQRAVRAQDRALAALIEVTRKAA
jgi:hypothetical protein